MRLNRLVQDAYPLDAPKKGIVPGWLEWWGKAPGCGMGTFP